MTYQVYYHLELGKCILSICLKELNLVQGVLVRSRADFAGEGPQADKVTLLFFLLCH